MLCPKVSPPQHDLKVPSQTEVRLVVKRKSRAMALIYLVVRTKDPAKLMGPEPNYQTHLQAACLNTDDTRTCLSVQNKR